MSVLVREGERSDNYPVAEGPLERSEPPLGYALGRAFGWGALVWLLIGVGIWAAYR